MGTGAGGGGPTGGAIHLTGQVAPGAVAGGRSAGGGRRRNSAAVAITTPPTTITVAANVPVLNRIRPDIPTDRGGRRKFDTRKKRPHGGG